MEVLAVEKDIFKGKIKKEYIGYVKFSLIFAVILFFISFAFFLLVALLYDKLEYTARVAMFVLSGISFLAFLLFPIISIYAIRSYPKHPRLAKLMIKPFVFKGPDY